MLSRLGNVKIDGSVELGRGSQTEVGQGKSGQQQGGTARDVNARRSQAWQHHTASFRDR